MIRLVTQFDNAETRPSLATPTCCGGCCCCCCCCLATIIGSSSLTAMHVNSLQKSSDPPVVKAWPILLAIFALPISLGVGFLAFGAGLLFAPVLWAVLVGLAFRGAGSRHAFASAAGVAALGTVAFVGEFVVALLMLDVFGAYLGLSLLVGFGVAAIGSALIK